MSARRRTWLCLGVDPVADRLPHDIPRSAAGVTDFCCRIVESTADVVCAYKINFAFFEALGPEGWHALDIVRRSIPNDIPVIADAKRSDIPNTSAAYARSIFELLGFDAVTASPYLGWDAIEPFLGYTGRAVFILCKTSNPGSGDLQDLVVGEEPVYMHVARSAIRQQNTCEVGLVVGATHPAALRSVRRLSQELLLLVPGVGAQGAQAAEALATGANASGENALVPVSREILYASSDGDFAEAARRAAESRAQQLWIGAG